MPPRKAKTQQTSTFACLENITENEIQEIIVKKKRGRPKTKPSIYDDFPIVDCMGRSWIYSSDGELRNTSSDKLDTFRLVSYNMLCQDYAKKPYFPHLSESSEILSWMNRRNRLLDEFNCYSADILCLQEVDRYSDYWKDKMSRVGYASTYSQRTGGKPDGCATFWRSEKFDIIQDIPVMFNDVARHITKNSELENHEKCDMNGNVVISNNSISKFLTNNVANIALLRHKSSDRLVCIVNLHLFWDPAYPEVKLCQIFYTMLSTRKFLKSLEADSEIQVFFCGDYNSMPDSEVYEFLTRGETFIPGHFIPFYADNEFSNHISISEFINEDGEKVFKQKLVNPFKVATSMYKLVSGEEPLFTNFTKNFRGCLDYVMACNYPTEENGIVVNRSLKMITEEQATEFEALPSIKNASDHISLTFDFDILTQP